MTDATLPSPEDCRDWLRTLPGRWNLTDRDREIALALERALDERDVRMESAHWARGALRRIWCLLETDRMRPAVRTVYEALGDGAPRLAAVLERDGWAAAEPAPDPAPTPLKTPTGSSQ